MKKPKVLLSGLKKFQNYIDAVENAGGVAQGAYTPEFSAEYDGLILCGGGDVDPALYGETVNGAKGIDRQRDEAELSLVKTFLEAGKPVLGICRGCQLVNVFFGGTLHQDLETAKIHRSGTDADLIHTVRTEENSLVNRLYGSCFKVNSFHHQAIKQPGEGLTVTAISEADGVIEAAEHETLPVLAIQWHPERLCCSHKRPDAVDGTKIFQYFIDLCKSKMREGGTARGTV